jgi:hypothetical protein
MRKRFMGAMIAAAIIAVCATLVAAQDAGRQGGRGGRGGQGAGQGGRGRAAGPPQQGIPCTNEWQRPNGCAKPTGPLNPHDFTGVWTRFRGPANMGNEVKMTPAGQKLFEANKPSFGPRAVPPAFNNDPLGLCDPLGLTRNLFTEIGGRSIEFAHLPDRIIELFEWAHYFRTIWMDGRQLPKDPTPRWHGYSVGRWDGDTLVVESNGFDARTWLDHLGHPHSENLRVVERYRRPTFDTLELQMTFTDPEILAAPWVSPMMMHVLNIEKSEDEKLETFCVPSEEQDFNKNIRDPAGGLKK